LANLRPPWKSGQSGNASGKRNPISSRYLIRAETVLPKELLEKINGAFPVPLLKKGAKWADAVALRLFVEAVIHGDTGAAREVREAIEGRASQRIEFQADAQTQSMGADSRPYILAVREALGFYTHDGAHPAAQPHMLTSGNGRLYDELVQIVRSSPDENIATLAATLAAALQKKGETRVQPA
jgi:hypothetical protein